MGTFMPEQDDAPPDFSLVRTIAPFNTLRGTFHDRAIGRDVIGAG